MTSRIAPLIALSLLLAGSLVYAGPAAPAAPGTAQTLTSAEPSPCAQGGPEALIFAPAPQENVLYCGICSPDPCRGVQRGTTCGYDYETQTVKRCQVTTASYCPQDNRAICSCYSGPIP